MSVREAKATLSALLDRVERGATVTIRRRGRRVARLVPARTDAAQDPEAVVLDLERRGVLLPGGGGMPPSPVRPRRGLDLQGELHRQRARR